MANWARHAASQTAGWRNLSFLNCLGRSPATPSARCTCRNPHSGQHDPSCTFRTWHDEGSPAPGGWIPPEFRAVPTQEYRDPVTGASLRRLRRRTSCSENARQRREIPATHHSPLHRSLRPTRPILRRNSSLHEPQTPLASQGGVNPGAASPAPPISTPQPAMSPIFLTSPFISPQGSAFLTSPFTSTPHLPSPGYTPYQYYAPFRSTPQTPQVALPVPIAYHWPPPPPPPTTSYFAQPITLPPAPPTGTPSHTVFLTPSGNVTWTPHPAPHPQIAPAVFWTPNALTGADHATCAPLWNPNAAMSLSGGYPLPGTAPNWAPMPWPVAEPVIDVPIMLAPWLIPNPNDPLVPHLIWDITKNPSTAKRLTGRHVILNMSDEFEKPATAPPVNKVVVVCDLGKVSSLWPPIEIERANPVTVWDIMHAIYEFFQKPMTQREVDYVSAIEPGNYEMLCEAFYKRIYDSSNIPEWERLRGIKRVDVLGDRRVWWGLWITYNPDDTWQLNLGLMPLRQSS